MKTSFDVRGLDKVQQFFKELPRGSMRTAIKAFGDYILGDDSHGLRHIEPYKFVSRKAAYGQTFFSDKQRRFFFANIDNLKPGSGTRHDTTRGWRSVISAGGYKYVARSDSASTRWTMSDKYQARQPAKAGHRKVSQIVQSNLSGALRAAVTAVNAWIRDHV